MKHLKSFLLKSLTLVSVFLVASFVLAGCTLFQQEEAEDEGEKEEQIEDDTEDEGMDDEDEDMDEEDDSDTESTGAYKDVTPAEAQDLIEKNNDLLIVDVSPKYDEGHLLNSVNYYVGDGSLDEAVSSFDKDRTYLVYCHVDSAAIAGAEKLIAVGIENVYRLEGNYSGWTEAGYSVITNISEDGNSLTGDLEDVIDGDNSGEGYILRSDKLNHKITADLEDLEEEKFYEGWLVNKSAGSDFFSTGKMVKTPEGEWLLEYVSDDLKEGYDYAVITLEAEDDGQPEEHIIEGNIE